MLKRCFAPPSRHKTFSWGRWGTSLSLLRWLMLCRSCSGVSALFHIVLYSTSTDVPEVKLYGRCPQFQGLSAQRPLKSSRLRGNNRNSVDIPTTSHGFSHQLQNESCPVTSK